MPLKHLRTAALVLLLGGAGAAWGQPASPAGSASAAPAGNKDASVELNAPEPKLGFEPEDFSASHGVAERLSGVWGLVVKATVALAVVLMLVYLVLVRGVARFTGMPLQGRALRVVDRVGLEPRKTLYLVEVDGVRTLIGTTEQNMTMMVLPEMPAASGPPKEPT